MRTNFKQKKQSVLLSLIIILSCTCSSFTAAEAKQPDTYTQLEKLDTWNYVQLDKIIKADQLDLLKSIKEKLSAIITVNSTDNAMKEFAAMGITPRAAAGNIITADIPMSDLIDLLSDDNVVHIKICEQRHNEGLNLACPSQKTVIGIVDTGIVLDYNDFLDKQGNSRIAAIWDQTEKGMNGPYLSGATPGRLFTGEDIKLYFAQKQKTTAPGHGTYVTSAAAGNSVLKSDEGKTLNMVDCESPILLVETTKDEGDIIDAVSFIKKQCESWQLPGVVNLSYGTHNGPHDGTSELSQAVSNMQGEHFLVVASAGNEGESHIYANKVIKESNEINFVLEKSDQIKPSNKGIAIYGWYTQNEKMDITVISPEDKKYGPVSTGTWQEWSTDFGSMTLTNGISNYHDNKQEIQLVIQNTDKNADISEGKWQIKLIPKGGDIISTDFWVASSQGYICQFYKSNAKAITFSDLASANNLIVVGGYNSDKQKKQYEMAKASGKGSPQDNKIKPDVLAPFSIKIQNKDKQFVMVSGTSFSAPLVTRLISSIWNKYPLVSGQDISQYLHGKLLNFGDLNYTYSTDDPAYNYISLTSNQIEAHFKN